jgi:predicted ATP-dependent serine protease
VTSVLAVGVRFACKKCKAPAARWIGQCPRCQTFGSIFKFTEEPDYAAAPLARGGAPANPPTPSPAATTATAITSITPLRIAPPPSDALEPSDHPDDTGDLDDGDDAEPVAITSVDMTEEPRLRSEIEPLDRVLGGGLVEGSILLLGGKPGCGKSTLLAQALAKILEINGDDTDRVLYATGEESIPQVAMRAHRVLAADDRILVVHNHDVDRVLRHAERIRPLVLVVDSISILSTQDLTSAPGTVPQVRECTQRLADFAKTSGTAVVLIGHVTRDGTIAGPNTLDHIVDVVLQLYKDPDMDRLRYLRAHKNRFGDTSEAGGFEMTNLGLVPNFREPEDLAEGLVPVAQEILRRYRELGGVVDEGLRDRIAGRLDLDG